MNIHTQNKELIGKFRTALYDLEMDKLPGVMNEVFAYDAEIKLCSPFGIMAGPKEFYEKAYAPLIEAIPDLERRDYIVAAGPTSREDWVGCAGTYVGVFEKPWLDIPPTFHPVFMRFHEFYRIEDGKVVEFQGIWDIPQVMMQAKAWPLAPNLGVEWMVPAPSTQDGLSLSPRNAEESEASKKIIVDMLEGLQKHAEGGPEAMGLEQFWNPKMTWYGPAGIGTNRRISGFRNWHQIPFLKAMPDRDLGEDCFFFGDGPYVASAGWPDMEMTLSGDGWMGIAPSDKKITMKSFDFWRCENGLIRENWVLIDIIDVYDQLGVDVFCRMREFTVDRQIVKPNI